MIEELSYLLFPDDADPDRFLLGFNRYNSMGFIDDGYEWSEEDEWDFNDLVLEHLSDFIHISEVNRFTYEVFEILGLEEKLRALGIKRQEPGWQQ